MEGLCKRYMWLHFDMTVSWIKDVIVESGSHAVMGKVLTLVLSRLSVGRRVVSLRWVVFTPTAIPTALVLVCIGVLISLLLTSTASLVTMVTMVTMVTITRLILGVSPSTLVGTV